MYIPKLTVSGLRCYNCKANNSDQCKHVKNLEIEDCAQVSETEKSKDVRQACSKIILEGELRMFLGQVHYW